MPSYPTPLRNLPNADRALIMPIAAALDIDPNESGTMWKVGSRDNTIDIELEVMTGIHTDFPYTINDTGKMADKLEAAGYKVESAWEDRIVPQFWESDEDRAENINTAWGFELTPPVAAASLRRGKMVYRAGGSVSVKSDAQAYVKENIKRRRALIRSLQERGIIQDDPTLRSLRGSLIDSMMSYIKDPYRYGEMTLSATAASWVKSLMPVYKGSNLRPPKGWSLFLKALKQIAANPQDFMYGGAAPVIQEAIMNYKTELMAVEDVGYADE